MPETIGPIPHEVRVTQQWIEAELVGKSICPPLAILAHQNQTPTGQVDWERMSKLVKIASFHKRKIDGALVAGVAEEYLRFITGAVTDNTVMSEVVILPDFPTNPAYDNFMDNFQQLVRARIMTSPPRQQMARTAVLRGSAQRTKLLPVGASPLDALNKDVSVESLAWSMTEGVFRSGFFYGLPLTDQFLETITDERGPRTRHRILMRAPYFIAQFINGLSGNSVAPNLNRARVHDINSALAAATDDREYDRYLKRLRGGR